MRSADKNLVRKGGLTPLKKNVTTHQQLHSLCFDDNRSKRGIENAVGPSKKTSKNCQSSNGSSSSLTENQCFGKRSSEPIAFANFQAF